MKRNGRSRTESTTVKIAVLPPIPSASVAMAIALKPGRASQQPHRVADVLTQRIQHRKPTPIAVAFFHNLESAKSCERLATRILWRHTGLQVVVDM
jgi:hypothetical protein